MYLYTKKQIKKIEIMEDTIIISAFSEDYSEKSYKFYYGQNQFEFVPKSKVKFIESSDGTTDFGDGVKSRYFELPTWLFGNLKGIEFYGI